MTLLDWLALWCVASVVVVAIWAGVIGSSDYHDEDGPA